MASPAGLWRGLVGAPLQALPAQGAEQGHSRPGLKYSALRGSHVAKVGEAWDRCRASNGSLRSGDFGARSTSGRKGFRCPACKMDTTDETTGTTGRKANKVKVKLVRRKKGGQIEGREVGGEVETGVVEEGAKAVAETSVTARDKNGRASRAKGMGDQLTGGGTEEVAAEAKGRKGRAVQTALDKQAESRFDTGAKGKVGRKLGLPSREAPESNWHAEFLSFRDAEFRARNRRSSELASPTGDEPRSTEGSRSSWQSSAYEQRLAEEGDPLGGARVLAISSAASDEEALARLQTIEGFLPLRHGNNVFHTLVLKDYWQSASELLRRMQQQSWWLERPALYIQLLFCLARAEQPQAAEDLVLQMQAEGRPLCTDILTALVKAYVGGDWLAKACTLLDTMKQSEDCPPNQLTYNILLRALVDAREAKAAELLFEEMVAQGISNTISHNMMIHAQSYRGEEGCAAIRSAVDRMLELGVAPDSATYNSMIHVYLNAGRLEDAIRTLYAKHGAGCAVQQPVYSSIIKALMYNRKWDAAELLYEDMETLGCKPDKVIHYLFINGYAKAGRLDRMMQAFDRMCSQGCRTSVQTYEKMVDALTRAKQLEDAMEVFKRMVEEGHQGSPFLYNLLIKACGDTGREEEAEELFEHMKAEGCQPNMVNYNTMLNVYAKAKLVDKMEALVGEMQAVGFTPDAFTFTTRMGGHKLVGDWRKVESIFLEMQRHGYSPNFRSLATLSGAYRDNHQFEKMQEVQEQLEAQGYTREEKDKRWILATKG